MPMYACMNPGEMCVAACGMHIVTFASENAEVRHFTCVCVYFLSIHTGVCLLHVPAHVFDQSTHIILYI
jgi:hypothetical protein